ncbi:MAG: RagB/SusD family nutrient uptake outer membrane protein [Cytophagaceae bacterium]|nr:RagB/SusD family nutrient uptake outer membrane protein [Cytophagaceae bacterium]MBL0324830.1 RagB/SusD family nutrient uptake outer membrane protein [Cytophagaceae bacterium]
MKNIFKKISVALLTMTFITSCSNKLDLFPQNDFTPDKAYANAAGYTSVLAKIYGTLSLGANAGGNEGQNDITGLDGGSQISFIRPFFNMQELPTDEAVVAWNDQTIKDFHDMKWTSTDPFIKGIYARPIWNVALINEFIRESTDAKLSERGITGADATNIKNAVAEVRFLRAFNYWAAMDLFGKYSFLTEADAVGTTPVEKSASELFTYIEKELLEVEGLLPAAKSAIYGRVDKAAAQALLARLYLNAKTYTGTEKNTEAATYAKKVIDTGYTLSSNYKTLFQADNHTQTNEVIWAINCDGLKTQGYGNTSFLVHAAAGDDFADFNVGGGWYGYRATKGLSSKFYAGNATTTPDKRALFTTSKFKIDPVENEIDDISFFGNGVHVAKWTNNYTNGQKGNDVSGVFVDTDFPVFRIAEMYLIYAEAVLRGGTGDKATAVSYINKLRERAYAGTSGNITSSDLTLQFILDERARELYWEGHRRTDLIRFDLFHTGTYLWPWKGGVAAGRAVDAKYKLYPVPAEARTVNTNLSQNTGY